MIRASIYTSVMATLAGGLLLAGCAESTGGVMQTEQTAKANTLGVRMLAYGKYQDAAWDHLASIGVHYVEIPMPAPGDVAATQAKLREHKLAAIMLTGKTDLSKPECVQELAGQLKVCEQMGVKRMFLSAKSNGAEKSVVYDRLRQAGEIAAKHGVIIVLETHPDLMVNGDVILQTMKGIHSPNVRSNFDTGNLYFYNEGIDAVTELKKVIDYVASVHLKETDGKPQSWNFPALGKGVVDFPGVIKTLNAHGFYGPFVIEIEGIKGVELNEQQTKQEVADSVTYLRKIAKFE
jgi:L-ribulose-5-phosphate 3-epimerase